jgi:Tfp pilus assembly protein PilN
MSVLEQEVPTKDLLDSSRGALPRVNLLPPEILVRRRVRRVQHGLGGGGLLVLALLAFVYVGAVGSAHDADAELREVTATGQAAQAERAGYADVAAVYARAEAAETMLATAMSEEVRYSTHLEQLARTVPDRLWLDNVTFSQTPPAAVAGATTNGIGSVAFTGVGYGHDDVATWLETLAAHEGYAEPALTSSTEALLGERVTVDFVTNVVLTPDALSRRYPAPVGR